MEKQLRTFQNYYTHGSVEGEGMLAIVEKVLNLISNKDARKMLEESDKAIGRAERRNGKSWKMLEEIDRMLNKRDNDAG